MSGEFAIAAALILPLLICAGIWLVGRIPDLREGVTLVGAGVLFFIAVTIALKVSAGEPVELSLGEAVPGLEFAFRAEPLGALFAVVASGLWIVNSFYSIGYMRGNRERNQTRFYMCFAIALFGAMGVALSANLFTLFVFYEILTLSTYPLVAHKGDANAQRGARIYLMTLLGTSIGFLLVAVIWTGALAGSLDFVPGGLSKFQLKDLDNVLAEAAGAGLVLPVVQHVRDRFEHFVHHMDGGDQDHSGLFLELLAQNGLTP